MKTSAKLSCAALCLALTLSALTACGSKKKEESQQITPTPLIIYVTPEPTATATPGASGEPSASPVSAATASPAVVTPTPAATTAPAPMTATPKPASAPVVTKSPTDERLNEGGTCLFVARADNASSIVWHLVSPNGQTDIAYDAAGSYFPRLSISGGTENTLRLSNVPYDLNGWRVYCRFGNSTGSVSSGQAVVSVNAPAPTAAPTAAPAPTSAPVITAPPAADYAGTYHDSVAGRATMTLSGSGSTYSVYVNWPSSANEYSEWTFSGSFDGSGRLSYSDGVKTTTTYDESGAATTVTNYTGGSGSLSAVVSGLQWNDNMDGGAPETVFVR